MWFMNMLLIKSIRCYQLFLRPYLGFSCRFDPSCSEYALQCFKQHRLDQAIKWTALRLMKCHPWHDGGKDPVPP